MSDLVNGLNPAQKNAVLTESGPLLILAGAGTGKTRVVTFRIAHLIRNGIKPERILAVTFTNKAANEMKSRVEQLIGARRETTPEVSTFHSLCVRILRRHIEKLGYRPRFTIYARGQQETLARQVLRAVNIPTAALKPSEFLWRVGAWKNRGVPPEGAINDAESDKDHLAAAAFRRYEQELKNRNAVDFDDLLIKVDQLLSEFEDVRKQEAGRFDHVMVDEYQDTNGTQYRIVQALAKDHQNLCVVGDDDQSIYGWRGAEVEHILRFSTDWPAVVVRLEENYRSTDAILQLSNRLIAHNKLRSDKTLLPSRPNGDKPQIHQYRDEVEEAREVILDIKRRMDRDEFEPRDYAILFRTNEQPRAFESELRRVGLPYVLIGGMSFFDRREVQDIIAYLRAIDDPDEETGLLRIINTPPRGIGPKTVETLLGTAVQRGESVWKVMQDDEIVSSTGPKAASAIRNLAKLINVFREMAANKEKSFVDMLRELLSAIQYKLEIDRLYEKPEDRDARWAAIEEVVNELGAFEQKKGKRAKLSRFIDNLTLNDLDSTTEKENQLKRNAIALMTYHASKGLEFRCVYMVGMEEDILPHKRSVEADGAAIEEERRLCYVGMTRAEDRLTMTLALTRRRWGKSRETNPSRFLFEIMGMSDNPHAAAKRPKSRNGKPGRAGKSTGKKRKA